MGDTFFQTGQKAVGFMVQIVPHEQDEDNGEEVGPSLVFDPQAYDPSPDEVVEPGQLRKQPFQECGHPGHITPGFGP